MMERTENRRCPDELGLGPAQQIEPRRVGQNSSAQVGQNSWTQPWDAEPRTTRGGQPWYSPLAILTALTVRAVFRLAFRQTEGLISSIIGLLGLTLRVPDHTTLSRRAATLEVPQPQRQPGPHAEALHLLVDSTGLKLCGAGEWLVEKHGTRRRRAWRKLHLG